MCHICGHTSEQFWIEPESFQKHVEAHNNVDNKTCEVCKKEFGNVASLRWHFRTVHKDVPKLKCEYEWRKYETIYPQGLEIHLKSVHVRKKIKAPRRIKAFQDESKLLNCNQCGFKTMFNHQLKLHIKSVHDKIKDIICKTCQFATTHKCVLVKHMRRKHSQILTKSESDSVNCTTPTIIKFVRKDKNISNK